MTPFLSVELILLISHNYFTVITCSASTDSLTTNYTYYPTSSATDKDVSKTNFKIFTCLIVPPLFVTFPPKHVESYGKYLKHMIEHFSRRVSQNSSVKIKLVELAIFPYDPHCRRVHQAMVECFEDYFGLLVGGYAMDAALMIGPWCSMGEYEHALIRLRQYFYHELNRTMDVAIVTTNPALMPITGSGKIVDVDKSADLYNATYPRSLMLIGGTTVRASMALWYLLAVHFRYRYVALVALGNGASQQQRYCGQLFDLLTERASIKSPRITLFRYDWYVQGNVTDDAFENVWSAMKDAVRIALVCSDGTNWLRVLKHAEADPSRKGQKYGFIMIMRSSDLIEHYVEELEKHEISLNVLDYLKFIAPDSLSCNKPGTLSNYLRNRSIEIPYGKRERWRTLASFYENMKCALNHYFELIPDFVLNKQQRLASIFAETYRRDLKTLISRNGRSVEWLPVWTLHSANKERTEISPVLTVDWTTSGTLTTNNVSVIGQLFWYGKDTRLPDAPYICKNVTRFFPCPDKREGHVTKEQMTVIVSGIIFALALLLGMVLSYVRHSVRNSRQSLIATYGIPVKDTEFNKNEKNDWKILIGKYNKQRHMFVSIKDQLQMNDSSDQTVPTWALRDIASLHILAKNNSKTLQPLVGYAQCGSQEIRMIFYFGLGATLKRILKKVQLSTDLKYSLARDLSAALASVHKSRLKVHGDLRSDHCVVDERFVIRIVLTRLPSAPFSEVRTRSGAKGGDPRCVHLLWTAPEILKHFSMARTQQSDVYSLGIIFHEIAFQRGPFYVDQIQGVKHRRKALTKDHRQLIEPDHSDKSSQLSEDESCAEKIVKQAKAGYFRPTLRRIPLHKMKFLEDLMEKCWKERPTDRPKVDTVLAYLEDYMKKCQIDVAYKTAKRLMQASKQMVRGLLDGKRDAVEERDRSVKYLMHMMPVTFGYQFMIAERIKDPQTCKMVTIYFNDLVECPLINQKTDEAISILDELYQIYDNTVTLYDVVPLHRVGTSLLLASGVPDPTAFHASEIALAALHIRYLAKSYNRMALRLKAGIHSGEVMCGMVGTNIPQFGLFGDTVNTASRMASTGAVNEIQMTMDAYKFLAKDTNFEITIGAERDIKGKGKMKTCWLKDYKGAKASVSLRRRLDGRSPLCERSSGGIHSRYNEGKSTTRSNLSLSQSEPSLSIVDSFFSEVLPTQAFKLPKAKTSGKSVKVKSAKSEAYTISLFSTKKK